MTTGRNKLRWAALALCGMALALTLVTASTLIMVGLRSGLTGWGSDEAGSVDEAQPRERSTVAVQAPTVTVETEGELVHAERRPALAYGPGTLTTLLPAGSPVEAGATLFEVDESPTVSLIGPVPAWRDLGVGDEGVDVEQLEANLSALGYDPDDLLSIDTIYTDYTATVVERWQTDLGVEPTGSVALGSVAFVPGDGQVISTLAAKGDGLAAGGVAALTISPVGHEVIFEVAADDLDTIGPRTEVSARLPDRSVLTAEVTEVVPTGDGTWWATATPTGSATGEDPVYPDGETLPLSVSWTHTLSDSATVVRANALTRLDNGAYVVEVVEGDDDSTRFVEVAIGARSGSMVEIVSDLQPGTVVITP